MTPTPGQPLSEADVSLQVGDRVIARADLRKHPDGPVFIAKGDEVQITDQYGINNCIAVVALSDGQTGAWAKSCFDRPHAPVSRPGDGVEESFTTFTVDELAQEIRRVDGNHDLGAGALAEALTPFIVMKLIACGNRAALQPGGER